MVTLLPQGGQKAHWIMAPMSALQEIETEWKWTPLDTRGGHLWVSLVHGSLSEVIAVTAVLKHVNFKVHITVRLINIYSLVYCCCIPPGYDNSHSQCGVWFTFLLRSRIFQDSTINNQLSRTRQSTINYPGGPETNAVINFPQNSWCGYFASARTKGNWKERGSERIKTLPALVSRRVSEGNLFSNSLQTYYVKHLCISCILELEERFCISLRPPSFAYKFPCLCLHE